MIPASDAVRYMGSSSAMISFEEIKPENLKEGQLITVTLFDKDANRDPNVAEKLTLPTAYDYTLETIPGVDPANEILKKQSSMPQLQLGNAISLSPFTSTLGNITLPSPEWNLDHLITTPNSVISLVSGISLTLSDAINIREIYATESNIFYFINYDIRSLNQKLIGGKINSFSIVLEGNGNSVTLVESTSNFQNYFKLSNEKIAEIKNKFSVDTVPDVKIIFENVAANASYNPNSILPIALDIFSFGFTGKDKPSSPDDYVINAVYRLELEETGADTDTFTGTVAYKRISAKDIPTFDFSKLITSGKNIVFPAFPGSNEIDITITDLDVSGERIEIGDSLTMIVDMEPLPPIQIVTNEDTPITVTIKIDRFFIPEQINKNITVPEGLMPIGNAYSKYNGHITNTCPNFTCTITFTPPLDYFGTFEFAIGGQALTGSYQLYTTNKLQITVNPINDPPNVTKNYYDDVIQQPILSVREDTPFEIKYDNCKKNSNCVPNGINLYEPDGDKLKFIIVQPPTNGKITQNTITTYTSNPDFVGKDSMIIKFSDGKLESENLTVGIEVTPVNDIPVANAGIEQSVNVGATVQLDASKSSDADNDPITYSWIQTAGYPVTLTGNTIVNPKFTAPAKAGQLTFMLTVSDGKATSNPAVINIYVGSTVPVPVPPPSPTSLSTTVANGAIALKWTPPAKDGNAVISDYVIEYKLKSDISWKTHNDGISASTSATVSGLKNDKSYDFRISAVNSAGIGEKSSIVSAVPTNTVKPESPAVKPESPAVKPDDEKKLAEKALADKKAADAKKIADKKIADKKIADKKIADKKAADAKKVAKAKK